jgi:hypothetical protein
MNVLRQCDSAEFRNSPRTGSDRNDAWPGGCVQWAGRQGHVEVTRGFRRQVWREGRRPDCKPAAQGPRISESALRQGMSSRKDRLAAREGSRRNHRSGSAIDEEVVLMKIDRVDVGGPAIDDVARHAVKTVDPAEVSFPGMVPGIVRLARAERNPGRRVAAATDAERKAESHSTNANE